MKKVHITTLGCFKNQVDSDVLSGQLQNEDFDIIEMYQRKGFGSFVLRTLLKECSENGIEQAYLVTDHDDTAKDMYAKCGFKPVGKSFELMFHL